MERKLSLPRRLKVAVVGLAMGASVGALASCGDNEPDPPEVTCPCFCVPLEGTPQEQCPNAIVDTADECGDGCEAEEAIV